MPFTDFRIVEYLEDHKVADNRFISGLKKALECLRQLEVGEERVVLMTGFSRCLSIYIEVRSSNVRASLQALNLDYLEISVSEFNDVASIEGYIAKWGKHLEFAVKHLLEAEYKLCNDVFERMGLDVWKSCFADIAAQAGILAFLQFGKTITESKKDPIKLLKLLEIFASLNRLRLDFNRLFGGAACAEIQNWTRDLIKRHSPPLPDGSIPRVVTFIADYCNELLGDDYKSILTQVLVIERSWKHEKFQEGILMNELLNLVKAIELNVETWSRAYEYAVLSYVFLMNTH
ncbi:exocyst subunit exo70 family protein G1 [Forsythia ovata]|uniref:Exocyst subunit Exo70 family protein n=1 Tax=Forsythia ovata TaxID=205694 RepID=A0ABD1TP62_9LAMI